MTKIPVLCILNELFSNNINGQVVREIRDTLEQYKAKADETAPQPDGSLRYTFNTRTSDGGILVLRLPHRPCVQPPRVLEDRYGLKGLAAHYQLPEGLTATDLQAYTKVLHHACIRGDMANRDMQQRMQKAIERLEELNPVLKTLKPVYDHDTRYDILQGIAADFTVRDMQFYIDGNSGGIARQNPVWAALEQEIEARIPVGWIPSFDTLRGISAQLDALSPTQLAANYVKNHRPKI